MILILIASIVCALVALGAFALGGFASMMSDAPGERQPAPWFAIVMLVIAVLLFAEWWWRW